MTPRRSATAAPVSPSPNNISPNTIPAINLTALKVRPLSVRSVSGPADQRDAPKSVPSASLPAQNALPGLQTDDADQRSFHAGVPAPQPLQQSNKPGGAATARLVAERATLLTLDAVVILIFSPVIAAWWMIERWQKRNRV
ncbi:MAG: hypothetical protein ABL907_17130 [Hyphomicrobium sp.]